MGTSPSRSISVDHGGEPTPLPEGVYNPFDRPDNLRINFPAFDEAMEYGDSLDSGPSIDTLASLYPVDFQPRSVRQC